MAAAAVGKRAPSPPCDRGEGAAHPVPPVVAVQCVEAAGQAGHRGARRQRGFQRGEVLRRGAGRRVAAVAEGVDAHRDALPGDDAGECDGMVLVRVHAPGRDQAQQVAGASRAAQGVEEAADGRRLFQRAVRGGPADARQLLHDDAAGADVEVADLRIAHLPVRQADILAGRAQERVRPGRPQPVEPRRMRLQDGVVGGVVTPSPAIQDDQGDGTGRRHCHGRLRRKGGTVGG